MRKAWITVSKNRFILCYLPLYIGFCAGFIASCTPKASTPNSQPQNYISKSHIKAEKLILNYEKRAHIYCSSVKVIERRPVSGRVTKFNSADIPAANYRAKYEEWKINRCGREVLYEVRYTITYHKIRISVHPKSELIPEHLFVEHIAKRNKCNNHDEAKIVRETESLRIYNVLCHDPMKLLVFECKEHGCSMK